MDSEIERLVLGMHNSLCQCGEWCYGAQRDYELFTKWVEDFWGSTYPLEDYLIGVRDARPDNE